MSQEKESNIQLHVTKVEELYNSSRVTTEKKLNKISKQLEALDMIVRKVNAKKNKGKEVKGYDKVSKVTTLNSSPSPKCNPQIPKSPSQKRKGNSASLLAQYKSSKKV